MRKKLTFTYKNKEFTIKEFSDAYCIGYSTISRKLLAGENPDDIIKSKRSRKSPVVCKNKTYDSILDFCSNFNITYREFVNKLSSGISVQEIVDELSSKKDDVNLSESEKNNEEAKTTNEKECILESDEETDYMLIESDINYPIPIYNEKVLNKCIEIQLRSNEFNNINLIDFENVSKDNMLKNIINDPLNINIFFFNGCIYSNEFYKLISNSNSLNYYVVTLEIESQLIDHLLLYYLGTLSQNNLFKNMNFNIISKDTHFYKLQKYIYNNIKVIGLNYISNTSDKFIYSLSNYIINNNYIHNQTCLFKREFATVFGNFFKMKKKQMNDKELDNLINTLLELGFVKFYPETDNMSAYYTFNLVKIKQENRRLRKQARA